jgi:hypothetical protein
VSNETSEDAAVRRSKEIADEFDVFRPKTPAAFKPEY